MFKRAKGMLMVGFLLPMMIVVVSGMAFAGDTLSLVGEISDDFLIVTDSEETYEVMVSDQGIELMDHVGERVKVTGEIINDGDDHLINVVSFEVLSPAADDEEDEEEEPIEGSVEEKQ